MSNETQILTLKQYQRQRGAISNYLSEFVTMNWIRKWNSFSSFLSLCVAYMFSPNLWLSIRYWCLLNSYWLNLFNQKVKITQWTNELRWFMDTWYEEFETYVRLIMSKFWHWTPTRLWHTTLKTNIMKFKNKISPKITCNKKGRKHWQTKDEAM